MSKSFMFKLLLGLSVLAAAVLWLLSIVMPETFGAGVLNVGAWAILIVSGGWAVAFILLGLFGKNVGTFKKMQIYFGAALAFVAIIMLIKIFAWPDNIILPIIAVVAVAGLLLGMIAVGGKKWDQGDNQNVGYKNYRQRKADEEKKNKD